MFHITFGDACVVKREQIDSDANVVRGSFISLPRNGVFNVQTCNNCSEMLILCEMVGS